MTEPILPPNADPVPVDEAEFDSCLDAMHRMRQAVYGRRARYRNDPLLVDLAYRLASRRMGLVGVSRILYDQAYLVRGTPARRRSYWEIFFH
jgi:hypothetical protein